MSRAPENRVRCAEFLTRTGKIGATVRRSTDREGRTTYSYDGAWGAGSGHSRDHMQLEIERWREGKRGMRETLPWTEES